MTTNLCPDCGCAAVEEYNCGCDTPRLVLELRIETLLQYIRELESQVKKLTFLIQTHDKTAQ